MKTESQNLAVQASMAIALLLAHSQNAGAQESYDYGAQESYYGGAQESSYGGAQESIFEGPALSFSNLEIGYEQRDFDLEGFDEGHGFHTGFSLAPIPILYVAGDFRYSSAESFFDKDDLSFIHTTLGVGARFTLLETLVLYIDGGGAYGKLDGRHSAEYDGFGFYVEPGVKLALFGRLELSLAADVTSIKDETLVGAKGGAMFGITDNLGLTVEGGISDHTDFFGLGLRIAW